MDSVLVDANSHNFNYKSEKAILTGAPLGPGAPSVPGFPCKKMEKKKSVGNESKL